jgi:SPIRAL1-like protein
MSPEDLDRLLRQALLKDMRVTCRARGLSPAGGKEQLAQRLREHMVATGDL